MLKNSLFLGFSYFEFNMTYCSKFLLFWMRFCIFGILILFGLSFICSCDFWDSPFYSIHNAQIFFGLTGINVFMDFSVILF
jgi:hypothetical protein